MPESPPDPSVSQERPWWERTAAGEPVLLAFVRLGPGVSGARLSAEFEGLRQRVRYVSGVEYIAATAGAAQPLRWQGDEVTLFFKGDEQASAAKRAFEAARALHERMLVDLRLPVRMAVHAAWVPWNPEGGEPVDPVRFCEVLERVAPENGIAVTEDVYLVLPKAERDRIGLLGVLDQLNLPFYVFPTALVGKGKPGVFQPGGDVELWEAFRTYANGPEIRQLRYVGFPLQKKQPPSLDVMDVFVAPTAHVRTRAANLLPEAARTGVEWLGMMAQAPFQGLRQLGRPPKPFWELFAHHRALVVLGDPGSGKTTVLRWLAVAAAGGALGLAEKTGVSERLLPLMVSVGRLAEIRRTLGDEPSVVDTLARYFEDRGVGRVAELGGFLRRRLQEGACLVLLDGLDEVVGGAREDVCRWLEAFAAQYPLNRYVASCRQVGYPGFALPTGVEVVLGPFNDDQVRRYVTVFERACRRWEAGVSDDAGADRESKKLLDALLGTPRLRGLAANPFMLSSLVLIHRAEGQLPRHRVHAYEVFARTLCETWGSARKVVAGNAARPDIRYEEEAIPILGELALQMHREWPTGVAPERFVIDILAKAIKERDEVSAEDARKAAQEFLQRAGTDVQLLLERGPGQWGFLHLTFQEFFAAVGLHSAEQFEEEARKHLLDPRWEEVLRLGVGYMALVQKRSERTGRFIEEVLGFEEKGERRYLTQVVRKQVPLAALLAAEAGDVLRASVREKVAKALAEWMRLMPFFVVEPVARELALTDFRERLIGVLAQDLRVEDWRVQCGALYLLWRAEGIEAAAALHAMERDKSPWMVLAAAMTLRSLGRPDEEGLLELCHSRDGLVRLAALLLLANLNRAQANEILRVQLEEHGLSLTSPTHQIIAALLADAEPTVRLEGELGEFLMWVWEDLAAFSRVDPPVVKRLWQRLKGKEELTDEEIIEIVRSIDALGAESLLLCIAFLFTLTPKGSREAVLSLVTLLHSSSWKVRLAALIGSMAFLREAMPLPAQSVSQQPVLNAGELEHLRQEVHLLLADPIAGIRVFAVFGLLQHEGQSLLEHVRPLLSDPNALIRVMAAAALAELVPAEGTMELVHVAETSQDWLERNMALGTLWQFSMKVTAAAPSFEPQ